MKTRYISGVIVTAIALAVSASDARASQIDYSGQVFGKTVPRALVIVGTFADGFNVGRYTYAYGDVAGNLDGDAYKHAVADGNFHPIGAGTLTATNGMFSATGSTDAAVGTPIWMFVFDASVPQAGSQVLASSTSANWTVPVTSTTLLAAEANEFVIGFPAEGGVRLNVVPFPEPLSVLPSASGVLVLIHRRRLTA